MKNNNIEQATNANQPIWGEIEATEKVDATVTITPAPTIGYEDALQVIIDSHNNSCVEHDQMMDEIDRLTLTELSLKRTIVELKKDNHGLNNALKEASTLAQEYLSLCDQHKLLTSQKTTNDKLLKIAQKERKGFKANADMHRKNNATLNKRNDRLAKELKELRKSKGSDMPQLSTIYDYESEVLIVYPQLHKMHNGTEIVEQAVLLYSDRSGVFLTACLDCDNQAVFSSPMRPNKLSERTIETYRKHSISPSEEVQAFATSWLYRVNKQQKTKVERADLIKFEG